MPKKVDRTARREELLDAALRVFARKGFAASRIDDVAAEAGIAKGSVYLSFDSRDALLEAVFQRYAARSEQALAAASAVRGPALDRLAALVRGTVAFLAAHPEHARVLADVWACRAPLDLAAVHRAHREAVARLLADARAEGTLRPGVGAAHAAVVVGAVEGCLVQWLADPRTPLAELAGPIVEVCVEGLRA
ncbi:MULTISPECIES: TetR/AcrR family transcriptional regulator [Streptomyces]|uniref:TetR/AcrR family transcriptional regulator n=1 Tax=Streptomyces cremeus TaxID=66881 RepID=A0ABV5PI29_STRCM